MDDYIHSFEKTIANLMIGMPILQYIVLKFREHLGA